MLKIISILGSFTFLSRILGYVRDLLIARVIGAGLISDAFFISFKLPNLFRRLLAEGSMNSAFIPVVSGISNKFGRIKADIFFSRVFSALVVILFILLIIFEIFMPVIINIIAPGFNDNPNKFQITVELSRLTFPFVLFVCLTSLAGAYLNTLGKFAAMAFTPVILNLTMIGTLLLFFNESSELLISKYLSFSISLAGLFQIIWMMINLKKNNVEFKFQFLNFFTRLKFSDETKKLLTLLLPAIIGNGAYQLNLLIDMILASTLPDGSISYLYYADRVNQLPLGVLGIAISTAMLPILSNQMKRNESIKAKETISKAIKFGIIFSIPSFIGLCILSDEIITFLFFRGAFEYSDVKLTGMALMALSFGLPAFIMIKILVVPFFANEDTKTPVRISIISMFVNLALNLLLIKKFLHVGLAIATSISAWFNVIMLFYFLLTKIKIQFDKTILNVLAKVLFSSISMGLLIQYLVAINIMGFTESEIIATNNLNLLITIFIGTLFYFLLVIYIFRIKELKLEIWKKF